MSSKKRYYEIFGVSETKATLDDLKKAYKKAALKHHPEKGGNPRSYGNRAPSSSFATRHRPQGSAPSSRSRPKPMAKGEDVKADLALHDQEAPGRSRSVRKSVSWNPELVSESPPPPSMDDVNKCSLNMGVDADGSNPYVTLYPGLAAACNFSFKDQKLRGGLRSMPRYTST